MEHSGCKTRIDQLEKDRDTDRETVKKEIFPRLRALERTIWIAQGASLVIGALLNHLWR
jgi:hypothetical protein